MTKNGLLNLSKVPKISASPSTRQSGKLRLRRSTFFGQQANGIYILGAYARGDYYNSEMSDEELLGALGVMIGHEISHAFDSTGAQFDKNGDMRDWWTEEDYAKFFRAFAGKWLSKDSLQCAYFRINDTHPMNYLRANCTLQQYDEFLDFYGITEGDNMYLAPEDRVAIW